MHERFALRLLAHELLLEARLEARRLAREPVQQLAAVLQLIHRLVQLPLELLAQLVRLRLASGQLLGRITIVEAAIYCADNLIHGYQVFQLVDASLAICQISREAVHHHTEPLVLVEAEVELCVGSFC